MKKGFYPLFGLIMLLAMLLPATSFAATSTNSAKSHRTHLFLVKNHGQSAANTAQAASSASGNGGNLAYHGGPVIAGYEHVYAIFWESGGSYVSPHYNSLIEGYFYGFNGIQVLAQYPQADGQFPNYSTLTKSWVDTSTAYPGTPGTTGNAGTPLQDSDIQNEVAHAQSINGWPTSGTNNLFFVFTAQNEGLCFDSTDCTPDRASQSSVCAYHSSFGTNTNTLYVAVPYAVSPNFNGNCATGASPNKDDADSTISVTSHEQMGATTDPLGNGWYDANGGEIGDKCASSFGPAMNGSNGADVHWGASYLVQQEWSNAISGCTLDTLNNGYEIANLNSNLAMDVSGGSTSPGGQVIQWSYHNGINQQWALVPDGPFYQIMNINSGLVLDVFEGSTAVGTQVIQWTNHHGLNQQWVLVPHGSYDLVKNVNSGLVLDISGSSTSQGTILVQNSTSGTPSSSQLWNFLGMSLADYYELIDRNALAQPGLVIDVAGNSANPGAFVVQEPYYSGLTQEWVLISDGNYYQIENFASGLVLDVSGGSMVAGARVIQWTNHHGLNQEWQLLPSPFACLSGNACQLQNVNSGLVLDVSGGSTIAGAPLIQWPNHGGLNQQWQVSQADM